VQADGSPSAPVRHPMNVPSAEGSERAASNSQVPGTIIGGP
jgi:hypothetical protein